MKKNKKQKDMTIKEAILTLEDFINAYEYCFKSVGKKMKVTKEERNNISKEYEATKLLVEEYKGLYEQLMEIMDESEKREQEFLKLEMIVQYLAEKIKEGHHGENVYRPSN